MRAKIEKFIIKLLLATLVLQSSIAYGQEVIRHDTGLLAIADDIEAEILRPVGIGLVSGINKSYLRGMEGANFYRIGYVGGVAISYKLSESSALLIGFLFSQKGGDYLSHEGRRVREELSYIDLPLLWRFSLIDFSLSPFINMGATFANRVERRTDGEISKYGSNKQDVMLTAGAGLLQKLENNELSLEARFDYGICDFNTYGCLFESSTGRKNVVSSVRLTWLFYPEQ